MTSRSGTALALASKEAPHDLKFDAQCVRFTGSLFGAVSGFGKNTEWHPGQTFEEIVGLRNKRVKGMQPHPV